jgi:hypothetical protein
MQCPPQDDKTATKGHDAMVRGFAETQLDGVSSRREQFEPCCRVILERKSRGSARRWLQEWPCRSGSTVLAVLGWHADAGHRKRVDVPPAPIATGVL